MKLMLFVMICSRPPSRSSPTAMDAINCSLALQNKAFGVANVDCASILDVLMLPGFTLARYVLALQLQIHVVLGLLINGNKEIHI